MNWWRLTDTFEYSDRIYPLSRISIIAFYQSTFLHSDRSKQKTYSTMKLEEAASILGISLEDITIDGLKQTYKKLAMALDPEQVVVIFQRSIVQ